MQEPGRRLLCLLQRLRQPRTKNLRGPRRGGGAKPGFQQPHLERISRLLPLPPRAVPSAEPHARPGRRHCRSGQRRQPRAHGCAGQMHTGTRCAGMYMDAEAHNTHGCTRAQGHLHAHGCTSARTDAEGHTQARWQSSAGAEQPAAGRHGAWRSCARGRLLRHHLQPTPPPADRGHSRAQSRGPSSLLRPRGPQPHNHLDLLGSHRAAGSDLAGKTQGDPGRAGTPTPSRHRASLAGRLVPGTGTHPSPERAQQRGAVRLSRGRCCVPGFPFLRLIAPVAAEPSVKHLIFYSRIELENTINISLRLKDPSQPGTKSQPAGGIAPAPGGLRWPRLLREKVCLTSPSCRTGQ